MNRSSIGKFVGSAAIQLTLLFSCTYDYDQFRYDVKASTSGGSSSGGAPVDSSQGGTTVVEHTGGTTPVGSDAGQSSLGYSGGSSGIDSGGSSNNANTGGTTTLSATVTASGGDLGLGGNGGTSGLESGGTSGSLASGGTSQNTSTGGQSPTGGSSSVCGSLTNCGAVCADLSSDARHCGQCSIDCTAGGLSFGCYLGVCGCALPVNCGSGSGVDCVNHLCVCSSSTCGAGQVCQKHGNTQNCAAP